MSINYTNEEIEKIFNSSELFDFLSDKVTPEEWQILLKIKTIFSDFTKEIYLSYEDDYGYSTHPAIILSMTDKRGVLRFRIKYRYIFNIYETFKTGKRLVGQDILDLVPINSENIIINEGRVYFNKEEDAYELQLWTLLMGDKLDGYKRGWDFKKHYAASENNVILFEGFGEVQVFRLKYDDVTYKATFDLSTGKVEIIELVFSSYDYK